MDGVTSHLLNYGLNFSLMYSYHDTVTESGVNLDTYESKAKSQELLIMDFFNAHKGLYFGASQIWMQCFEKNTPITSVRRSLTNLSNDTDRHGNKVTPRLKHLDIKIKGLYGRSETVYTLPFSTKQTTIF